MQYLFFKENRLLHSGMTEKSEEHRISKRHPRS